MTRLSPHARSVYDREMRSATAASSVDQRWHHLERAHIVSQPDPWLHTCNHGAMLKLAWQQHDRREALGQVIRLVLAAPGSLTGRYPDGNTGRTSVGLFTSMAWPDDLAASL